MNNVQPSLPQAFQLVQQHAATLQQGVDTAYHTVLLPIFTEFGADLETPISAFLKIKSDYSALFESVENGTCGRYSFVVSQPYHVIQQSDKDPLHDVQHELAQYHALSVPNVPDFIGGAVGYIGYDCVRFFEPTVQIANKDTIGVPDSIFMFCQSIIVFDHLKRTIKVLSHARIPVKDIANEEAITVAYNDALARLETLHVRLNRPCPSPPTYNQTYLNLSLDERQTFVQSAESDLPTKGTSNVGQQGYETFVKTLKEHISAGDIIQAVPSQRISRPTRAHPFEIYRQMRMVNPSPYMFYMELDGFQIVGASPEMLVKVDSSGKVHTRPIAGTRKRGQTPEEDEALAQELLGNVKERAEHIMLVDLGRNDVGSVSKAGSVKVDSLMHIERYSHVMHIVSHVSGKLADDKSVYDAFRAVFPAGTVSGAPKVRACQLVSGLEQQKRNIYAGSVGYISYSGVMDTCIAIRTLVFKDGVAHMQAGAGIVFDSEETAEYEETISKMMGVARAVDAAEKAVAIKEKEMDAHLVKVNSLPASFGSFGGRYVPETLIAALDELEKVYIQSINDPTFHEELKGLHKTFIGRPTPLYYCGRATEKCGGAKIWVKREDLCHTGAHKINNAIGQALLAKRIGKKRIIAETGAGQHGVSVASACALLNLECIVYMGLEDVQRQSLNVFRMKLMGAKVVPVTSGSRTLKDAVNEAMRDWVTNVRDTFYIIGSAIGPHPFPTIVRDFQAIIGQEARAQMLEAAGKLPDVVMACVGGGSNAIGTFHPFVQDKTVEIVGVEAAGHGIESGLHSASIGAKKIGVFHGTKTYVLQNADGQITEAHSVSAGLDYPGVSPIHAYLSECGRASYVPVTDDEALQAFQDFAACEGIIPALETAHVIYEAMRRAKTMPKDKDILICLSGRGDKDCPQVSNILKIGLQQ